MKISEISSFALSLFFDSRVRLTGGKDVIIRFIHLKHHPHALNVVTCMAPITLGINVTQVQGLVDASVDACHTGSDLASHKGTATTRRFVVEENTVGQMHAVGFSVVDEDPEGVLLGDSVRRTRVEWSCLGLRNFLDLTVKFRGGCLVKFDRLLETCSANCIKHTQHTDSVTVSRVLRHVE